MNAPEATGFNAAIESLEAPKRHQKTTLSALLNTSFEPVQFLNKPFVAEGLTIFAGRPKIGKSTLIRQLILALSSGSDFLGNPCVSCDSLFLCLEEGERMTQNKFTGISEGLNSDRVDIKFEWPRGIHGISELRQYLTDFPNTRFVAIDSLSRFRDAEQSKLPQFQQDYELVTHLHALTKDFPFLCIVVLHHTKKMKSEDPIDAISGTYGITAACDSYGVLLKEGIKYRLHWGGRNWELDNADFELSRDNGRWALVGEWDLSMTALTPVQQQIIGMLKDEGTISTTGLARRLEVTKQTAGEHLRHLTSVGAVVRRGNDYSLY